MPTPSPSIEPPQAERLPAPAPLLVTAVLVVAAIGIAPVLSPTIREPAAFGCIAVALVGGLFFARRWPAGLLLCAGLAFAGVGVLRWHTATELPPNHVAFVAADEAVLTRVTGRIARVPRVLPAERRNPFIAFTPPPRTVFVLDHLSWEGTSVAGRIRVSVTGRCDALNAGQRVTVDGFFSRPARPRNVGAPDWRAIAAREGIHAVLRVDGPEHVRVDAGEPAGLPLWSQLRARMRALVVPDEVNALTASERLVQVLVLGQRSLADDALEEPFQQTGTAHFLAVSGFHVGVLAGAFWWLGRRLRLSRRAAAVLVALVVVTYALIAEPHVPITRAVLLTLLVCGAVAFGRNLSPLNWLGLAAMVLLLHDPQLLFQASFQLSFTVVLALLLGMPLVRFAPPAAVFTGDSAARALRRWIASRTIQRLAQLFAIAVIAWLASLPIIAWHFGRVIPLGPLFSLLTLPLVVLLVPLGFLATLAQFGLALFGIAPLPFTDWPARALLAVVTALAEWPGRAFDVTRPPLVLVLVSYLLTFGPLLVVALRNTFPLRSIDMPTQFTRLLRMAPFAVVLALWIGWAVAPGAAIRSTPVMHVLSLGRGNAVIIENGDGTAQLLDCGTPNNADAAVAVRGVLRTRGIDQLTRLTLTNASLARYSGVPSLLHERTVPALSMSPYFAHADDTRPTWRRMRRLVSELPALEILSAGSHWVQGAVRADVLWPPADLDAPLWSPNDRSLVMRLELGGVRVLVAGDLERAGLAALLDRYADNSAELHATVLLAPRRGTVTPGLTERLLEMVRPEVIIIASDVERPALRTIAANLASPPRVLNTATQGMVIVRVIQGGQFVVDTPLAATEP